MWSTWDDVIYLRSDLSFLIDQTVQIWYAWAHFFLYSFSLLFLLFLPLILLSAPLLLKIFTLKNLQIYCDLFNCYLLFFYCFYFTSAFCYSSSSHAYFIFLSFIFIVTFFSLYLGLDVILFSAFYFSCHLHFASDFRMYLGTYVNIQ